MKTLDGTIWGTFLQRMLTDCHEKASEPFPLVDMGWENNVGAFLDSGANVNERIYHRPDYYGYRYDGTPLVRSTPVNLIGYRINFQFSALSVLQRCLASGPKFSAIEDACIASGASLYSECTEIILKVHKEEHHHKQEVDVKLSKQQSSQFLDGLAQPPNEVVTGWMKDPQIYNYQVVEFFHELDVEQLLEQARREEALQGNIIQEQESSEDDSSNGIKSISYGSSIDPPDSRLLEIEGSSHSAQTPLIEDW